MRPRVLVANRSEIACRVFQAVRELGMDSVALMAPGDEEARHVTYADFVTEVDSYLNVDAIVAAIQRTRSGFVHPGYGFLSERSVFVRAVEAETDAIFIGPRPETMDLLGGKIAAKEFAASVGVPTLPWKKLATTGTLKISELETAAKEVGFPLLIKAAAGGGGKGMRRVDRVEDVAQGAESAASEAIAAFGDGNLFFERYVENPRHIEVQVFGDGVGGAVHFHERECSLQRRHQKIWEEAPAPRLNAETRTRLTAAAIRLTAAVKYRSAGTIEFILEERGGREEFYFLEMNTRLQVEHPVTELVTGTDLVHLQLELARAAAAKTKFVLPETPLVRGHAIEVRFCAEDPAQGFVPSPGKVDRLRWPTGAGIRVESGIEEGQTVGMGFDSLLAKIIVHAPTREKAVARMREALADTVVQGSIGTNQGFLRALCDHADVKAGQVDTGWIGRKIAELPGMKPGETELAWIGQALATMGGGSRALEQRRESAHPSPWVKT